MTTQPQNTPSGSKQGSFRLTTLVKRLIDFFWFLSIGTTLIWAIAVVIIGVNIPDNPDDRHTDINFLLDFRVFSEPVAGTQDDLGKVSELIQGQSELKLNNTQSHSAWYIANSITLGMGLLGIVGLFYLRKIFQNLNKGEPFAHSNYHNIQKLGLVFIVWNLVFPVITYLGGLSILKDVGQHSDFIQLSPAIVININGLFAGAAIIVLAQIIKEAATIKEEQSLTI